MPYITKMDRADLDETLDKVPGAFNEGELNYQITRIIDKYLKQEGIYYGNINACIGVLECAKLELYRRIASPYEDAKKEVNGDVYSCLED